MGASTPLRLQNAFVSDEEITRVVEHAKTRHPIAPPLIAIEPSESAVPEPRSSQTAADALTAPQQRIMHVIQAGPATAKEIQADTGLSERRVYELLADLKRFGYIVKPADRYEIP